MSDTPETDRIIRNAATADHPPTRLAATLTVKCEKLERERDEALKSAKEMSESNQVLQAEVRGLWLKSWANTTAPTDNETYLKLVLEEVAKLAKTLKAERDEAQYKLEDARQSLEVALEDLSEAKRVRELLNK